MTCREDHPERHPDFEPGNLAGLRHGAYSEQMIAERTVQVHQQLLAVAPWCAEDRYLPAVDRYLKATAREQLAHEALMTAAKLSPRLLEAATSAARLAWQIGDQLGLTPAGHARLKATVAAGETAEHTLADVMATGRQVREARLAREAAERPQEPTGDLGTGDDSGEAL